MTSRQAARAARRIRNRRLRAVGLLVVIAAIAAAFGDRGPASTSSTVASTVDTHGRRHHGAPRKADPPVVDDSPSAGGRGGALGEADGAIPDGTTVFDDQIPGVANLDPALLGALRQAAAEAADDGVGLVVNSGWRSPAYQEHLLDEAIAKYGSEAEARRWVATPDTSAHVSGDAVDIGPTRAAAWLAEHGAAYGLCRVYGNEPWHYELRPEAGQQGCPSVYADATHDPRMRQ